MKFGVNTFIWTVSFDRSNFGLLPPIKEAGFDGIEFPIFEPENLDAAAIRRALDENGLEATVVSILTGGMNLASSDASVRRRTRDHMAACIQAAAEVGARILAGPLYSPVGHFTGGRRTAEEWKWVVDGYQTLGRVLESSRVTIAIEPLNRFETYFLNTADDAIALVDAIGHPNVGILFDTFHANIEEKDIGAAYRRLGKRLRHVHTCENDRGIPGSGHVEWPQVFQALRDLGYDGWLTIESFGFALSGLSSAASIWRDLAPSPGAIAFEGLKFLKQNMTRSAAR